MTRTLRISFFFDFLLLILATVASAVSDDNLALTALQTGELQDDLSELQQVSQQADAAFSTEKQEAAAVQTPPLDFALQNVRRPFESLTQESAWSVPQQADRFQDAIPAHTSEMRQKRPADVLMELMSLTPSTLAAPPSPPSPPSRVGVMMALSSLPMPNHPLFQQAGLKVDGANTPGLSSPLLGAAYADDVPGSYVPGLGADMKTQFRSSNGDVQHAKLPAPRPVFWDPAPDSGAAPVAIVGRQVVSSARNAKDLWADAAGMASSADLIPQTDPWRADSQEIHLPKSPSSLSVTATGSSVNRSVSGDATRVFDLYKSEMARLKQQTAQRVIRGDVASVPDVVDTENVRRLNEEVRSDVSMRDPTGTKLMDQTQLLGDILRGHREATAGQVDMFARSEGRDYASDMFKGQEALNAVTTAGSRMTKHDVMRSYREPLQRRREEHGHQEIQIPLPTGQAGSSPGVGVSAVYKWNLQATRADAPSSSATLAGKAQSASYDGFGQFGPVQKEPRMRGNVMDLYRRGLRLRYRPEAVPEGLVNADQSSTVSQGDVGIFGAYKKRLRTLQTEH